MKLLSLFAIGILFGLGIALSGMINPAKVINFFDLAGSWDPSLAFVMGGAVTVTFIGYRMVLKRPGPLFGAGFGLPTRTDIDARLVGGSAAFGVGWGIAGFCPGAAIPAIGTGMIDVALFIIALTAGLMLARRFDPARRSARPASA